MMYSEWVTEVSSILVERGHEPSGVSRDWFLTSHAVGLSPTEAADELTEGGETQPFNKFMDDIILKESKQRRVDATEDTPQRKLIKAHRELPLNRMKVGRSR